MAPILKSLTILLAIATITYGERVKKSEKRGIADFGSGFSTSRLEGSGIKISTDFGKEITLEEYKQNGYSFGNNNYAGIDKDVAKSFNLGNNKFGGDIDLNLFYAGQQLKDSYTASGQDNQAPQPYQIIINGPAPYPLPHAAPMSVDVPKLAEVGVPQPYPMELTIPYPGTENNPVSVPNPQPADEAQKQEIPVDQQVSIREPHNIDLPLPTSVYDSKEDFNQNQNVRDAGNQEQSKLSEEEQKQNVLQNKRSYDSSQAAQANQLSQGLPSNINQIISHESESTANNGFVPSSGHGLFSPQSGLQQALQSAGHQQLLENHSGTSQGFQSAGRHPALSGFSQGSYSSGLPQGGHQSSFGGLQQQLQSGESYSLTGVQAGATHSSLAELQKSLQSGSYPSFAGHQQSAQSNGDYSLSNLQQGLQAMGGYSGLHALQSNAGYSALSGHQQGLQIGNHAYLAGLQGAQSVGDYSSLAGLQQGYQSGGGEQGQQDLEQIQQALSNSGARRHGYSFESNEYSGKM